MTNRLKLFPGLAVMKEMILAFGGERGGICVMHLPSLVLQNFLFKMFKVVCVLSYQVSAVMLIE